MPDDAPPTPPTGPAPAPRGRGVPAVPASAGPEIAAATATCSRALTDRLARLGEAELMAPSLLPGWSRLTVACHLRFGAVTLRRMTVDALAGRPSAYYPEGRAAQRPATLAPAPGESPAAVVASLGASSEALAEDWSGLAADDWARTVDEPDLGGVSLATLGLLRLTEVEVHGTDLDVGVPAWSETLVRLSLPFRMAQLPSRRRRLPPGVAVAGGRERWLLRATDGPAYLVTVDGPDAAVDEVAPAEVPAGATLVEGTSADLLAVVLGRPTFAPLTAGAGQVPRFAAAFPGP